MIVRAINKLDVNYCIHLGEMMHNESSYKNILFEPKKLHGIANRILEDINWFGAVAEDNNKIIGMMIGFVSEYYFSSERYAADLCVYVIPEYRGSSAALRLMNLYTRWASQQKIKEIRIGATTQINPNATAKFYKKLGFEEAGTLFMRPVH